MSYGEIHQKGVLKLFKDIEKKNALKRRILLVWRCQDRSDARSLRKIIRFWLLVWSLFIFIKRIEEEMILTKRGKSLLTYGRVRHLSGFLRMVLEPALPQRCLPAKERKPTACGGWRETSRVIMTFTLWHYLGLLGPVFLQTLERYLFLDSKLLLLCVDFAPSHISPSHVFLHFTTKLAEREVI